jgi:hypothetical protein
MSASDQSVVTSPIRREVTAEERDAAIFVIGLNAAFGMRGMPSSFPRSVFNGAVEVALAIAGKVGKTDVVGQMDYTRLRTMLNVANEFGFDSVRSR